MNHRRANNGQRRAPLAFTLIELLVVLAVIGILASLTFPALSSAKLRALQLQCMNNLRQMNLAHMMYMHDYQGHCLPYSNQGGKDHWMGILVTYQAKVEAVRFCPVANDTNFSEEISWGTANKPWSWHSGVGAKRWMGSYCMNGWLFSDMTNMMPAEADNAFIKENNIRYPVQTPVFCDGVWNDAWPMTNDPPAANLYNGVHGRGFNGPMGRVTIPRHGGFVAARAPRNFDAEQNLPGAINIACYDGHVELAKLESLWGYYWTSTWAPPRVRPD